ncbi:unannotated protein [freshwater metagenome]|uniref:Unannotated protein n=1 Tax=freshwater metagenome TaxID=449393 RepID=A0A6J6D0W5_9ZZZZ
MASSETGVPVGLFGEQKKVRPGLRDATAVAAVTGKISKSASRSAVTHCVPVPDASSGYIEYVGGNPSTERPGPPKA